MLSSFSITCHPYYCVGFPGGARGKEPAGQCRRHKGVGSVPGLERSPEEGHGNSLQCSCLKNLMGRGIWQATAQRVAKSQAQLKGLSTHAHILLWAAVIQTCSRLYGPLLREYITMYLTIPLSLDTLIASGCYRATINNAMSSCSPMSRMTRLLDIHILRKKVKSLSHVRLFASP